jgi:hypothetical protein
MRRAPLIILPGLAACLAVLYVIWSGITMILTNSDVRCNSTTCDIRGRCLRATTPAAFGGATADFSTGGHNCVGKFVPAPLGATEPKSNVRVHEHPGGGL